MGKFNSVESWPDAITCMAAGDPARVCRAHGLTGLSRSWGWAVMARFQGENLLILLFAGLIIAAIIVLSVIGWVVVYEIQQSTTALP